MPTVRKPPALKPGAKIRVVLPASPARGDVIERGLAQLRRLGYSPNAPRIATKEDGYFAGETKRRAEEFLAALADPGAGAIISVRGGYGSTCLVDALAARRKLPPRILLGFSDLTALCVYLWQAHRWVTFHGPMVAAGFDCGPGAPGGYDENSFRRAVTQTKGGWTLDLEGETITAGEARGVLLGGCLTLIQCTLGTPWELDTRGAILVLEDRGMRPYQVDRVLTHLRQAGKLRGVRGVILGEFPECPSPPDSPSVRKVCARILGELKVPVIWGAPIGHTSRPMLTLPLGVRAKLVAKGSGQLEILEPAVTA
jgi:muramoyltetrapeptide carboxypeptidase